MSPASSYNGFIFYIFLSKNRRQRIFFKKMPGSALFPDEPAPQTAAKKFPEGRSPPGTEKKKHTSPQRRRKNWRAPGPAFVCFPKHRADTCSSSADGVGPYRRGERPSAGCGEKGCRDQTFRIRQKRGTLRPPPPVSPPPTERGLFCHISRWLTCDRQGDVLSASSKLVRGSQRLPADTGRFYLPVSGFSLPPSVVLELSSVLSVMDSRSISPSAMTYSPRVRVRNSQAS